VIGVEAGTHPLEQTAVTRIVGSQGSVYDVTVQPVVSTVINGRDRVEPQKAIVIQCGSDIAPDLLECFAQRSPAA